MNNNVNYNLSINLELIRTIYKWLSRKTTSLSTTESMNRFYKYVDEDFYIETLNKNDIIEKDVIKRCKARYDNFVVNHYIEKKVANKLIESGIPANCLRTDSATKLLALDPIEYSSAQTIFEYQLYDFVDEKIRAKTFWDVLTNNDMEKLDRILANIPSEKICFILLLVHYLMKQIHYINISASDRVTNFLEMLEHTTYDPTNKEEVELMENLLSQMQKYITPKANTKIELVEPIMKNTPSQAVTVQRKPARRKKTEEEIQDKLLFKNVNYVKMAKNAMLIRESCKLVAEAMGLGYKKFASKFYAFLGCSATNYDHLVKDGYAKEIKQNLVKYGIPKKYFNKDDAELIPTPDRITDILQRIYILKAPDQIDAELCGVDINTIKDTDALLKEDLIEALKDYLFVENPTDSNVLYSLSKKIVTEIYKTYCFAPDTSEALFDLVSELELDGTNFKYKDMKKQLEEIAKSYYENELVEKDEDADQPTNES